jgi:hypothetical protein
MQERLFAVLQPRTIATAGRLSDRPRFIALRAEVAQRLYPLLHLPGAATGWLPAPALLLSGRALRQPNLLPPCRRRSVRRALARHEPNHRTAQENYSHLWPEVTRHYKGKLQTELEDLDLPNPVIRSHYAHGFAKQYVRDDRVLRTEPATNDVTDYGVKKNVENLPPLRQRMSEIIDHYHDAQQDILETFIDRGQLQKLAASTALTNGKRIPGLKLDHPRQLAVMHALVRYANIAAGSTFTTADLYPPVLDALGLPQSQYSLASLRYDLSKLRAKGLLEKLSHSRRYRLAPKGYSICVLFLKLFERIYAPLTAGLLKPFAGDRHLAPDKRCQLDRLYQRLTDDLDALLSAVGLKTAA